MFSESILKSVDKAESKILAEYGATGEPLLRRVAAVLGEVSVLSRSPEVVMDAFALLALQYIRDGYTDDSRLMLGKAKIFTEAARELAKSLEINEDACRD